MVNSIYYLIKTHVVSQMTPVITLTEIETISGTPVKYKLYTCNTQWITLRDKITIDGVVYKVVDFVQNEYLVVTGSVAPVQLYFQISAPRFEHGTHRRVDSERKKTADKRSITPMIYMLPAKGTHKKGVDSLYGFQGKLRFFFLTTFDSKGDQTIETQQKNVVDPMSALSQYFFDKMEEREDIFAELEDIFQDDFMDFGDPATWGAKERIFTEYLSGVGAIADVKIYEQAMEGACCTDVPESTCLPAKLKLENILIETILSGGTLNIILKDTDGNTPTYSYDANTNTLTVAAGDVCLPVTMNFNGDPISETPAGGNKNIVVETVDEAPIGTVIEDTPTSFKVQVPNGSVQVNGDFFEAVAPGGTLNVPIVDTADNPTGTNVGPKVEVADSFVTIATQLIPDLLAPIRSQQLKNINIIDAIDADPVEVVVATDTESLAEIVLPNSNYSNSDATYTGAIKAGGTHNIPDITVTQPNGDTSAYPAVKNFACTLISALLNADLISDLTQAQILAIYEGRVSVNIVEYSAAGSYTYNKPANLLFADIICIGGGGGGASGQRRAVGIASQGGGGGGAGSLARRRLSQSEIASAVTIIVGGGGPGGAARVADDTIQNAGTAGGSSSFGALVVAVGGNPGAASNVAGSITNVQSNTPPTSQLNIQGGQGANGGNISTGSSSVAMTGNNALLSFGGGGGGAVSTTEGAFSGGAGSRILDSSNNQSASIPGGLGSGVTDGGDGGNGISNHAKQIPLLTQDAAMGYGSSGSGGGASTAGTGGDGGNGGSHGGGGGGGGGSRNGFASGKGGDGGPGLVYIYEFVIS